MGSCIQLPDLLDDPELEAVGAVEPDLGSSIGPGQVGDERAERCFDAGPPPCMFYDLNDAAGSVYGIVETEIAIGKKHMAGHFSRQDRFFLLHLGFDQGMAGFPHHRTAAMLGNIVVEAL